MSYLYWEGTSAEGMNSTKQLKVTFIDKWSFKHENQKYQNQLTSNTFEQLYL